MSAVPALPNTPFEGSLNEHLFEELLRAMNPQNALTVYQRTAPLLVAHSDAHQRLLDRVLHLGHLFTTATRDPDRNSVVGIIQRGNERIIYVHPRRCPIWVTAGDRVIVPLRPNGRRLAGSKKMTWSVYLQPLHRVYFT